MILERIKCSMEGGLCPGLSQSVYLPQLVVGEEARARPATNPAGGSDISLLRFSVRQACIRSGRRYNSVLFCDHVGYSSLFVFSYLLPPTTPRSLHSALPFPFPSAPNLSFSSLQPSSSPQSFMQWPVFHCLFPIFFKPFSAVVHGCKLWNYFFFCR